MYKKQGLIACVFGELNDEINNRYDISQIDQKAERIVLSYVENEWIGKSAFDYKKYLKMTLHRNPFEKRLEVRPKNLFTLLLLCGIFVSPKLVVGKSQYMTGIGLFVCTDKEFRFEPNDEFESMGMNLDVSDEVVGYGLFDMFCSDSIMDSGDHDGSQL